MTLTFGRNVEAPIYMDSADQSYYLDPASSGTGLKLNGNIELTGGGTIASTGNNNITIDAGSGTVCIGVAGGCAAKIDAGTFDPPYTINGKKYATYVPSMVGIKEETTGTVETRIRNQESRIREQYPSATIDFRNQEEGSDLWLFSKVTDIKKHIGKMTVLLSPAGNTRAWYEVVPDQLRLIIYTAKPTSVSYRLSAPRFDSDQWANTRDEGSVGHVINDPDGPIQAGESMAIDEAGYISGVSLTLVNKQDGSNAWRLTDALGNTIDELITASQATVANLTAGSAAINQLIAERIDAQSLTIGGKSLTEYIQSVLENQILNEEILSPIASDPSGVAVNLADNQTFGIYTQEGTPAAVFDSTGAVRIRGDLWARQATVSGALYADRIVTKFGDLDERLLRLEEATRSSLASVSAVLDLPTTPGHDAELSDATSATDSPPALITDAVLADLIARIRDYPSSSASAAVTMDATSSALIALIGENNESGIMNYGENQHVPDGVSLDSRFMILDSLLVSGPLLIGNHGIQAVSDTLYIEKGKTASLDIMAGTIIVNTTGDVLVTGNLAVSGNVSVGGVLGVNRVAPPQGELTIDLTRYGGSGSESGELVSKFGKLIFEREGKEVAAITASGAGVFRKLFLTSDGQAASSSGVAILPALTQSATVSSTLVTGESLIYVTPAGSTDNQVLYIAGKEPGAHFTVAVDKPVTADVLFNWWIIN
jgi:hypothetical protein